MTMSQSELDSFHNFATNILAHGNRDISLEDLVSQWHSQREHAETLASIRRGLDDAGAGRVHDIDDVDAQIRAELGFPARRQ